MGQRLFEHVLMSFLATSQVQPINRSTAIWTNTFASIYSFCIGEDLHLCCSCDQMTMVDQQVRRHVGQVKRQVGRQAREMRMVEQQVRRQVGKQVGKQLDRRRQVEENK